LDDNRLPRLQITHAYLPVGRTLSTGGASLLLGHVRWTQLDEKRDGLGGTGTFRADTGCWYRYVPAVQFNASK
jgi:hypothetical protein